MNRYTETMKAQHQATATAQLLVRKPMFPHLACEWLSNSSGQIQLDSNHYGLHLSFQMVFCFCFNLREAFNFNNIEGKITEWWLVNEEIIFSSFCFVKRAKLLAHEWSSGRLATAHSIEKLFFCNNGVLFRDS